MLENNPLFLLLYQCDLTEFFPGPIILKKALFCIYFSSSSDSVFRPPIFLSVISRASRIGHNGLKPANMLASFVVGQKIENKH